MINLKNIIATSLIELIASITIVSIALTSITMAYFQTAKAPSPAAVNNAILIADLYFNEILTKDFPVILPCPNPTYPRSSYTNICDYNNLINTGAKDQNNNPIKGLENYNIYVYINTSSNVKLGNFTGSSLLAAAKVARIDLKITNASMPDLTISAYKGNY